MNMPEPLVDLINKIKTDASITDPAEAKLIADIVFDASMLASRAATGEDVTTELNFAKASLLNIADKHRQIVVINLMGFFQNLIVGAIQKLVLV